MGRAIWCSGRAGDQDVLWFGVAGFNCGGRWIGVGHFKLRFPLPQTGADSVADGCEKSGVDTEGWRDSPGDVGMPQSSLADKLRDVFGPVASGGEEPWEDDDSVGTQRDAGVEGLLDGGLGKFHVGWFDDCVATELLEATRRIMEQRVAFGAAGTVVDKEDCGDGPGQAGVTPGNGM